MKTLKILIFGLPGSGKTFLANKLAQKLGAEHLNADKIRENANDWDFSDLGRRRQVERMQNLANESNEQFVILDFVCPIEAHRVSLDVSISISMDTVSKSRYEDTNMLFERPKYFKPDYHIKEKNSDLYANQIASHLIPFNWRKPTVQMLGRWQPFHDGHLELFKRALAKTGQVAIQVRDCQNWGNSNPFSFEQIKTSIVSKLSDNGYIIGKDYIIQLVPNITNITYGRKVGYDIEQESFDDSITQISGTKIRKEMGLS